MSTTGLLAIFVDLEPEFREEFREFLAEDMFPPRLKIGFGPGGSYDRIDGLGSETAQQFMTIYETQGIGDLYGAPYQDLRKDRAPRDADFHARFQNQDRYTMSLAGSVLDKGGAQLGDVLWVDRFDLAEEDTQDFSIWYETVYLPALADVDGLMRVRRYLSMEGAPKHLIYHQFASTEPLSSEKWQTLRDDPVWQKCVVWDRAPAAYKKVISSPAP